MPEASGCVVPLGVGLAPRRFMSALLPLLDDTARPRVGQGAAAPAGATPVQQVINVRRDYNSWVARETVEDCALRFTPRSFRKWSALRVANTAFGAASFLVLEAVGRSLLVEYARDMAAFEIEDTVPGIAASEIGQVFEPFTRGTEAGAAVNGMNTSAAVPGGTGLGLTIGKMLTDLMGGGMTVVSPAPVTGVSTLFRNRLFLLELSGVRVDHELPRTARIGCEGKRRCVPVVDNEEVDCDLLANRLEPLGLEIVKAASGRECLALLNHHTFDAILMDLAMPGIDGWVTLCKIRELALSTAPVATRPLPPRQQPGHVEETPRARVREARRRDANRSRQSRDGPAAPVQYLTHSHRTAVTSATVAASCRSFLTRGLSFFLRATSHGQGTLQGLAAGTRARSAYRELNGAFMSEIANLSDLYIDELKDLWSANDQMARALKKITPKATHPKLVAMLQQSQSGIADHTNLLKALIANQDEKVSKEHCKGMEGLVTEALKHTIEEGPEKGPVLDAAIIAQVQRMTHYGITGFGTVAAFAKALNLSDDSKQLKAAVKDMYGADELLTELAEAAVNADAADE